MKKIEKKTFYYLVFLLIIIFLVYGNTVFNNFLHYDDYAGYINNEKLRNLSTAMQGHNIKVIVSAAIINFFGINKVAFHLLSIFLHFLNSVLVFLIFKKIFNKKIGLLSGIVFAIHPVNVEAVSWLSGSIYLYSAFFSLLTLYFYFVYRKDSKLTFFVFSLISYLVYYLLIGSPWMFTVPLIILIFEIFFYQGLKDKRKLILLLFYLIPIIFYFTLKYSSSIDFRSEGVSQEYIGTSTLSEPLKIGRNIFKEISVLIVPFKLSIVSSIYHPNAANHLKILFAYATLIILLIYTFRKEKKIFILVLATFAAAAPVFAPFDIAVNLAERYFYLSSAFFAGLTGYLFYQFLEKYPKKREVIKTLFILLLVLFALRSFIRTFDWRNDKTLWMSAEAAAPNNYQVYAELGNVYYRNNNARTALQYYQKALEIRPVYPIVYHNIGLTFLKAGQLDNAETFFKKSIEQDPTLSEAYYRLGQIAKLKKDANDAKTYFEKALQLDPKNNEAENELKSL